jgi:tight adherence protein B
MKIVLLMQVLAVPVTGGIVATWLWAKRRERGTIAARLARWTARPSANRGPLTLLKRQESSSNQYIRQFVADFPFQDVLESTLIEAGVEQYRSLFLLLLPALLLLPVIFALVSGLNVFGGVLVGLISCALPLVVLRSKAEERRTKFCEQLPDSIDLMVAVLRSGHSISQAVRAVAHEIAYPCGQEFETILQRMNLGQPLSDALLLSSQRFRSYELDLMRRAVAIQVEVGGSLADLLDKTNSTLRQRLKLRRQLKVITAQSRLSAWIVGLLPVILAIGLNFINPGYLQLLIDDPVGRALLVTSLVLEAIGVVVMRRMSTMKV